MAKVIVLISLFLVVLYSSAHPQSAPIRADLTLNKILGALGGLFVLVLLIERATEIVISISRAAETEKLKNEVDGLAADATPQARTSRMNDFIRYQAATKGIALMTGFALSVFACAGGVGILKTIVDVTEADPYFMRGLDIALTSSLLAGGSDSFHQFVRALETFFQSTRSTPSGAPRA